LLKYSLRKGNPTKAITQYRSEQSIPTPKINELGAYPENKTINAESLVPIPAMVIGIIPTRIAMGTNPNTSSISGKYAKHKKKKYIWIKLKNQSSNDEEIIRNNILLSFLISEIKVWSSVVTLPIFSFLLKKSNTHLKILISLKSIAKNMKTMEMVARENINTGADTLLNVPLNTMPTNEKTQREKRSILFSKKILPNPLFKFK